MNLTLEIQLFELHIFNNYLALLMCYTILRQFPRWSFRWPSGQEAILSGTMMMAGIGLSVHGISMVSWHAPSRIILATNIILNRTRSFIFEQSRYRKAWKTIKTLKDRNPSICFYFSIAFSNYFKFSCI